MNEILPQTTERKLWYEGVNYTADAIILDQESEKILLVKRKDTSEWALPGGFVDPTDESTLAAAMREAYEEAGATDLTGGDIVYRGLASDRRSSPDRWIETSAHLFCQSSQSTVQAGDDAIEAACFRFDDLPNLYGSHSMLIERALDYKLNEEQLFEHTTMDETYTPVDGGYMKYDKYITENATQFVFVKQQPDETVVGPERWNNMLQYLEKEAGVMAHLRLQGFEYVPKKSAFRNGKLAMDAFRAEDGWQWKIQPELFDTYIHDTLAAFAELEKMPLPPDVFAVEPSYESLPREGWDMFDYGNLAEKIDDFTSQLSPGVAARVPTFFADIPELQNMAHTFEDPQEFAFCHLDMRQENLAWHPEHGVKIVDWSWAGPGLPGSDSTSLLIDLHKNGYDITSYAAHINKQHCFNLIGFWLAHSTLPNQGAKGLREQQFASALSAYELLMLPQEV